MNTLEDKLRALKFYPVESQNGPGYVRRFKGERFALLTKYLDASAPDRADDIVTLGFYDCGHGEQGAVSFPLMFLLNGTINIDYPYC